MYKNGYFVDQDEERALSYFKMAHIHGVERAKILVYDSKASFLVATINS
jgi:TPR repeat protein